VSQRELEHVETTGEAIDGVDDTALVDEDVVDLRGAGAGAARRRGDVVRGFVSDTQAPGAGRFSCKLWAPYHDGHRVGLVAHVDDPDQLGPVFAVLPGGLVGDDQEASQSMTSRALFAVCAT
jgi:hypothetical protein